MKKWTLSILAIGVVATRCAAQAPLKSPWDAHPVAPAEAPWTCPPAPKLPHDFATNSYYIDAKYSVIDPIPKKRYEDSVAGIDNFSVTVVKAADTWQTKGSRAAASCTVALLASAAQRKTLTGQMGGNQAFYVQGWNLGSWAVAWLKVRGSGVASADDEKAILRWLVKLAEDNRGYYEEKMRSAKRPNDADNNHRYWAGFAIAAAGIAANDRQLFQWGMNAYKHGVSQIRDDGTLPLEMARGQRALHYHLYALAPLVLLADFGEANGLDLYAEHDYAIRRLVAVCIQGLQDPSFFRKQTGIAQITTPGIQAGDIGWAQAWLRRFPDPEIAKLLVQAPWLNYTSWGGLPPP